MDVRMLKNGKATYMAEGILKYRVTVKLVLQDQEDPRSVPNIWKNAIFFIQVEHWQKEI